MEMKTVRTELERSVTAMRAVRQPYEADWAEIGRLSSPNKVDIGAKAAGGNRRRANTTSFDTAGSLARRKLVNGMATGMTSASRPWFKLTTHDPAMRDFQPVKEWLELVEQLIYNLFAKSNYYDVTKMQYGDLGPMGVGATVGLEHPMYKAVWHHMPVGSFLISLDEGLRLNRFVRDTTPTVEQLVGLVKGDFSKLSPKVKTAYDKGDYHVIVPCVHVIERNDLANGERLSPSIKKPWRSIRWEVGNPDKSKLVTEQGYDSQPVTAPRWETVGDSPYCDTSPGFEALPDLRELQLAARRKSRAMDNMVKPALAAPAGLARGMLSLDPGTVNYIDAQSGDVIKRLVNDDPRILAAVQEQQQWLARRVDELFYADLFMAISDMEGVQPRNEQELMYRNEEKLTQLGPVVDRVQIEKLEVDVDRAYNILLNLGLLPPIPEEMKGHPLEVEFISVLAQAQKAASTSAIERAARFVGFLAGIFPDAVVKFDAEQAIDEFATASGTTPKIIRTDEVVKQMKEQMAQQQQQAQMAQMAPAAKDGAQAAQLLSQTRVDPGTTALERVLGQ